MGMDKAKYEETLLAPEKHYNAPSDVTADDSLSNTQKREILEAWKANENALIRASSEGMDGENRPHLDQVVHEIDKLDAR